MNIVSKTTLFLFLITCTLNACKKDNYINQDIYEQNDAFFKRNNSIQSNQKRASSLELAQGPDLIDTIINELKMIDLEKKFANTVVKKYGLPKWEIALRIRNSNTYNSVFIPIVDSNGKVDEILFAYQDNKKKLVYKFINRNTNQYKLPELGNPEKTIFIQNTLKGIFDYFEGVFKSDIATQNNNKKTTFSVKANDYITVYCWYYTWAYSEPNGTVTVGTTNYEQCVYKIIVTTPIAGDIINDNSVPPPSSSPSDYTNPYTDPCAQAAKNVAEANTLKQDQSFINAINEIKTAASDGKEHTVSFGRTDDNEIIKSEIKTDGNVGNATVYTGLTNYFADIHNHPNNAKPSSLDLYYLVNSHQNYEKLNTRFVLMGNGELYALTITDYSKAANFISKYPLTEYVTPYGKFYDFPGNLRNQMYDIHDELISQDYNDLDANCFALAYLLNNNDTGLALLKYENNSFNRQSINGYLNESANNITYTKNNCN